MKTPAGPLVAIDGRAAARAHIGGVERVTRELAVRLPRLRPGGYAVMAPPRRLAGAAGHAWEQTALPLRARRAGAAAILCPANVGPLTGPPLVLLVHDLAPLRHPEWYSRAYAALHRRLTPALVRRARGLIVPSEFTRDELAALLGVDPARVEVVAEGVDHDRFRPGAANDAVLARHGLERPYVLTVGSAIERKNAILLERAAATVREHTGVATVAVGSGRHYMRAGEGSGGALRRLGYVPDADLPAVYAGAAAFVLPSRYEGFGLVCLEAMAAGTPVVAARAGALPEVCADGAILVDGDDSAAFAEAVLALLGDPARRGDVVTRGLARAGRYSWEAMAWGVDAVCRRAAGAPPA